MCFAVTSPHPHKTCHSPQNTPHWVWWLTFIAGANGRWFGLLGDIAGANGRGVGLLGDIADAKGDKRTPILQAQKGQKGANLAVSHNIYNARVVADESRDPFATLKNAHFPIDTESQNNLWLSAFIDTESQ